MRLLGRDPPRASNIWDECCLGRLPLEACTGRHVSCSERVPSRLSAVPEQYLPGRAPFQGGYHLWRAPAGTCRHNYAVNRKNEKKNAYAERPEMQQWGDEDEHITLLRLAQVAVGSLYVERTSRNGEL